MHELDDLYVRAKALWEQDPEKLEQEQPLLARAFADQHPEDRVGLSLESQRVRDLERVLAEQKLEAQSRESTLQARLSASAQEVQQERRRATILAEKLHQPVPAVGDLPIIDQRILRLEGELQRASTQLEDHRRTAGERERLLKREVAATQRDNSLLSQKLAEKEHDIDTLPSEHEVLASLGWRKGE